MLPRGCSVKSKFLILEGMKLQIFSNKSLSYDLVKQNISQRLRIFVRCGNVAKKFERTMDCCHQSPVCVAENPQWQICIVIAQAHESDFLKSEIKVFLETFTSQLFTVSLKFWVSFFLLGSENKRL